MSSPVAVGVDVSARHGLDVVALDRRRRLACRPLPRQELSDLRDLLEELRPGVVAIDSPPRFAAAGQSRQCERELARRGIHCYFTPARDGARSPFYDWMRKGQDVFQAAEDAGYPLYVAGRSVRGGAIEVFPHASAVVLRARLPPGGSAKSRYRKTRWRKELLRRWSVDTAVLLSLDLVDAALAALTGLRALYGSFCTVGDPRDGTIVLPARSLADSYARSRGRAALDRH
jgi:predicted nuclease with RNAse H fold